MNLCRSGDSILATEGKLRGKRKDKTGGNGAILVIWHRKVDTRSKRCWQIYSGLWLNVAFLDLLHSSLWFLSSSTSVDSFLSFQNFRSSPSTSPRAINNRETNISSKNNISSKVRIPRGAEKNALERERERGICFFFSIVNYLFAIVTLIVVRAMRSPKSVARFYSPNRWSGNVRKDSTVRIVPDVGVGEDRDSDTFNARCTK